MKQRIVTAAVGLCVFYVILFWFQSFIFNGIIAIVAVLCVYEFLHAFKMEKHIPIMVISCVFSFAVPLLISKSSAVGSVILVIIYTGLLFIYALKNHEKVRVEDIGVAYFISMVVTFALMPLLYIRDQFGPTVGLYYILIIFACAWGSDSGAYFVGRFFGKRKLAPKLSPNKTIAGVVGGVISCLIFVIGVTLVFTYQTSASGESFSANYFILIPVSIVGSLIGVLGDLFASMIKRQQQIKDYGHIMPGHGGMVDRLDSTFFIAPYFFVVLQIVNIIV